jgi:hypothetical protein
MPLPDLRIAELYYTAARTEIVERMKLRDNALVLYATGVSAIIGVAFGQVTRTEVLLLLPFVAFVAALIANHHSEATGALGYYCARELSQYLPHDVPQWDSSYTLQEFRTGAIRYRLIGESALFLVPPGFSLLYVADLHSWSSLVEVNFLAVAWWIGLLFALVVALLQILTLRARHKYYERTWTVRDA